MVDAGYPTPEAAALAGMVPGTTVIASASEGDAGYVLVNGGTETYRYLYGINVVRVAGRWREGSSGNGPGWSMTSPDDAPVSGTWTIWDDVPGDVDRVRIGFKGQPHELAVTNRCYFAAFFHCASDSVGPTLEMWRRGGEWQIPSFFDLAFLRRRPDL